MIVEALINLKDAANQKSFDAGDIITIQPKGAPWGVGDLKGRIVVQIDIPDPPCGADFMTGIRCSQCEHQGIAWADPATLTVGETAQPKLTCPKEQISSPDVTFEFIVDAKGMPGVNTTLSVKRRARIVVDDIISPESKIIYLGETVLTEAEKDAKLAVARKPSNLISADKVVIK